MQVTTGFAAIKDQIKALSDMKKKWKRISIMDKPKNYNIAMDAAGAYRVQLSRARFHKLYNSITNFKRYPPTPCIVIMNVLKR